MRELERFVQTRVNKLCAHLSFDFYRCLSSEHIQTFSASDHVHFFENFFLQHVTIDQLLVDEQNENVLF